MSFERLTHKLYDDMTHDTDKVQNFQKIDKLTLFRNCSRNLLMNAWLDSVSMAYQQPIKFLADMLNYMHLIIFLNFEHLSTG